MQIYSQKIKVIVPILSEKHTVRAKLIGPLGKKSREGVRSSIHLRYIDFLYPQFFIHRFNNKAVAQIASDMVLLLADHVERLLEFYPEVPKKIVEVLARTLTSLIPSTTVDLENDEKRLLLALINCLGKIY